MSEPWDTILGWERWLEQRLGLAGSPAPAASALGRSPSSPSDDPIVGPAFGWLGRWAPAEPQQMALL